MRDAHKYRAVNPATGLTESVGNNLMVLLLNCFQLDCPTVYIRETKHDVVIAQYNHTTGFTIAGVSEEKEELINDLLKDLNRMYDAMIAERAEKNRMRDFIHQNERRMYPDQWKAYMNDEESSVGNMDFRQYLAEKCNIEVFW